MDCGFVHFLLQLVFDLLFKASLTTGNEESAVHNFSDMEHLNGLGGHGQIRTIITNRIINE